MDEDNPPPLSSSRPYRIRRPSSSLISSTTSPAFPAPNNPTSTRRLANNLNNGGNNHTTNNSSSSNSNSNNNINNAPLRNEDEDLSCQPSSSTFTPPSPRPRPVAVSRNSGSVSPLGSPDSTFWGNSTSSPINSRHGPATPGGLCQVSSSTVDDVPPSPMQFSAGDDVSGNNVMLPPLPKATAGSSRASATPILLNNLQSSLQNNLNSNNHNEVSAGSSSSSARSSSSSSSSSGAGGSSGGGRGNFSGNVSGSGGNFSGNSGNVGNSSNNSLLRNKIKKASSFERFSMQAANASVGSSLVSNLNGTGSLATSANNSNLVNASCVSSGLNLNSNLISSNNSSNLLAASLNNNATNNTNNNSSLSSSSTINNSNLSSSSVNNSNLNSSSINNSNLNSSNINNSNLSNTTLNNLNISNSALNDANLNNSPPNQSNLNSSSLSSSSANNSVSSISSLSNSNLTTNSPSLAPTSNLINNNSDVCSSLSSSLSDHPLNFNSNSTNDPSNRFSRNPAVDSSSRFTSNSSVEISNRFTSNSSMESSNRFTSNSSVETSSRFSNNSSVESSSRFTNNSSVETSNRFSTSSNSNVETSNRFASSSSILQNFPGSSSTMTGNNSGNNNNHQNTNSACSSNPILAASLSSTSSLNSDGISSSSNRFFDSTIQTSGFSALRQLISSSGLNSEKSLHTTIPSKKLAAKIASALEQEEQQLLQQQQHDILNTLLGVGAMDNLASTSSTSNSSSVLANALSGNNSSNSSGLNFQINSASSSVISVNSSNVTSSGGINLNSSSTSTGLHLSNSSSGISGLNLNSGNLNSSLNSGGNINSSLNSGGNLNSSLNPGGNISSSLNPGGNINSNLNPGGNLNSSLNPGGNLNSNLNPSGMNANMNAVGTISIMSGSGMNANPGGSINSSMNGGNLNSNLNPNLMEEPMDDLMNEMNVESHENLIRELSESPLNLTDNSANSNLPLRSRILQSTPTKKIPLTPKQKLLHRMQSGELFSLSPPPQSSLPPPNNLGFQNLQQNLQESLSRNLQESLASRNLQDSLSRNLQDSLSRNLQDSLSRNLQDSLSRNLQDSLSNQPHSPQQLDSYYDNLLRNRDDFMPDGLASSKNSQDDPNVSVLYDSDTYSYYYGNMLSDEIFTTTNASSSSNNRPMMMLPPNSSALQEAVDALPQGPPHGHVEFMLGIDDDDNIRSRDDLIDPTGQFLDGENLSNLNKDSTLRNLLLMGPIPHEDNYMHGDYGGGSRRSVQVGSSNSQSLNSWMLSQDWSRNSWGHLQMGGGGQPEEEQDEVMDMSVMDSPEKHSKRHPHLDHQDIDDVDLLSTMQMPMDLQQPLGLNLGVQGSSTIVMGSSGGKGQIASHDEQDPTNPLNLQQHHHRCSTNVDDDEPVNLMAVNMDQEMAHHSHHSHHSGQMPSDMDHLPNTVLQHSSMLSNRQLDSNKQAQMQCGGYITLHAGPANNNNSNDYGNTLQNGSSSSSSSDNIDERRIIRVKKQDIESLNNEDSGVKSSPSIILDKPVQPKSFASLPSPLSLIRVGHSGTAVFTARYKTIAINTRFGPVEGPLKRAYKEDLHNINAVYPCLVMLDNSNILWQLDRTDDEICNWMKFVRFARNSSEQNAVITEERGMLYFSTTKEIPPKTELQVGYSVEYATKYGLSYNTGGSEIFDNGSQSPGQPADDQRSMSFSTVYPCIDCQEGFNSVAELNSHLETVHRDTSTERRTPKKKNNVKKLKFLEEALNEDMHELSNQVVEIIEKSSKSNENEARPAKQGRHECSTCQATLPTLVDLTKHIAQHYEQGQLLEQDQLLAQERANSSTSGGTSDKDDVVRERSNENQTQIIIRSQGSNVNQQSHQQRQQQDQRSFGKDSQVESSNSKRETPATGVNSVIREDPADRGSAIRNFQTSKNSSSNQYSADSRSSAIIENRNPSGKSAPRKDHQGQQKDDGSSRSVLVSTQNQEPAVVVSSDSSKDIKRSKVTEVAPAISTSTVTKVKCSMCYKSFATKDRLDKHMIVHSDEETKPLQCEFCPKRFLTNSALAGHIKTHAEEGKCFECPMCDFMTQQLLQLKEHVQTHKNKDGMFYCPKCSKKFQMYSMVRKHIRAFHGPRQFTCDQCPMSFPTSDKLKLHKLKHSDHREFLCAECGRQFKRKDKLREHTKRMHENRKKILDLHHLPLSKHRHSKKFIPKTSPEEFEKFIYKCLDCMMGFKRRGMLVNHLAKRHPEKPPQQVPELNMPILRPTRNYFCPYCERVYKSSSKRKSHILKSHPGKPLPPQLKSKDSLCLNEADKLITVVSSQQEPSSAEIRAVNEICEDAKVRNKDKLTRPELYREVSVVGKVMATPHKCDWCHRQYATRAKLLQHQRKSHLHLMPPEMQLPRTQKNNVVRQMEEANLIANASALSGHGVLSNENQPGNEVRLSGAAEVIVAHILKNEMSQLPSSTSLQLAAPDSTNHEMVENQVLTVESSSSGGNTTTTTTIALSEQQIQQLQLQGIQGEESGNVIGFLLTTTAVNGEIGTLVPSEIVVVPVGQQGGQGNYPVISAATAAIQQAVLSTTTNSGASLENILPMSSTSNNNVLNNVISSAVAGINIVNPILNPTE